MAGLSLTQIINRLNDEFTGDTRKLVFWYDDNGEFVEDMQNVALDNAKSISCSRTTSLPLSSFWSGKTPRPII